MLPLGALDSLAQALRRVGLIEPLIVDGDAFFLQRPREMAHGGEDEGDLLRMMADVGGFLGDLGHDHHVAFDVQVLERA